MCRNLEPEVKKDMSFGEFEIVAEKSCWECFLMNAVQHRIQRNPACRHIMKRITGIDCQEENISFKKVRDFTMATPRNTVAGDIVFPKHTAGRWSVDLVVKYVYPEDCDKFGYAIIRNNKKQSPRKESDEPLNDYVIEVRDNNKAIKKFTLESYRK